LILVSLIEWKKNVQWMLSLLFIGLVTAGWVNVEWVGGIVSQCFSCWFVCRWFQIAFIFDFAPWNLASILDEFIWRIRSYLSQKIKQQKKTIKTTTVPLTIIPTQNSTTTTIHTISTRQSVKVTNNDSTVIHSPKVKITTSTTVETTAG